MTNEDCGKEANRILKKMDACETALKNANVISENYVLKM